MRNRISSTHLIAVVLFVLACVLGVWAQMKKVPQVEVPRARFNDATPLGGKGLRLMLERMGYSVKRMDGVLPSMPKDARVWVLLDPQAGFTRREAGDLMRWVKDGGTLIWAATPVGTNAASLATAQANRNAGIGSLHRILGVEEGSLFSSSLTSKGDPLPPLSPLNQTSASEYWMGVKAASGTDRSLRLNNRPYLEIAGAPDSIQLAAIPYGKGRVFVAPDALLFTNYALSKPDNAVLISNLIRAHETGGTVYFDERAHGEDLQSEIKPSLLYYLWRPPLRYALLQLLVAGLLLWAFFGRRLGAPVPLPDGGPVTRASQFAAAMGALFHKVHRPRAAATIIGEDFRRQLTKRLGLSIADSDELIAQRASEATGFSSRVVDRLLLNAKTPDDDEERA
jgi:hypothetical protein